VKQRGKRKAQAYQQREVRVCGYCLNKGIKLFCPNCEVMGYCGTQCLDAHEMFHQRQCELLKICFINPKFNLFHESSTSDTNTSTTSFDMNEFGLSLLLLSSSSSWSSSSSSLSSLPLSISKSATPSSNFTLLPIDHYLLILEYLESDDLLDCVKVSKSWYYLANDDSLWGRLCKLLWCDKQNYKELISPKSPLDTKHTKFQFFWSIRDSNRVRLTEAEMSKNIWRFSLFKSGFFDYFPQPNSIALFSLNPRLRHNPCLGDDQPWRLYNHPKRGTQQMQVANFPVYVISRSANWGWILTSELGVYASLTLDQAATQFKQFGNPELEELFTSKFQEIQSEF